MKLSEGSKTVVLLKTLLRFKLKHPDTMLNFFHLILNSRLVTVVIGDGQEEWQGD